MAPAAESCRDSDAAQWLQDWCQAFRWVPKGDSMAVVRTWTSIRGWSPCKSNPAQVALACARAPAQPATSGIPHTSRTPAAKCTSDSDGGLDLCTLPIYPTSFAQRRRPVSTPADFPLLTTPSWALRPIQSLEPSSLAAPPLALHPHHPPVTRTLEAITGPGAPGSPILLIEPPLSLSPPPGQGTQQSE